MKIEYIIPNQPQQSNNPLGCFIMLLFLLGGLFVFLSLLPLILIVLAYSILFLGIYVIYKAYLESFTLNLIQKLKSKIK